MKELSPLAKGTHHNELAQTWLPLVGIVVVVVVVVVVAAAAEAVVVVVLRCAAFHCQSLACRGAESHGGDGGASG